MAATGLSKEMLEAHPGPARIDRDLLAGCIDHCLACLQSCTACADADLAEDDVAEMRRCIRICLDCADVCDATARLLSRQTEYVAETARAQVASCWELCAICARECERSCGSPRALPALRRGVQALRAGLFRRARGDRGTGVTQS